MKYCRSKEVRRPYLLLSSVIFLYLLVVALQSVDLLQMHNDSLSNWARGFALFSVAFLAVINVAVGLILVWQLRKYEVFTEGISVAYFSQFPRKISWESISEIAICRVHYSTRGGWDTVIRIAVGPEFRGPAYGAGAWSFQRYSIKNQHRIIIIDYSDEKLAEFQSVCPLPILDYR